MARMSKAWNSSPRGLLGPGGIELQRAPRGGLGAHGLGSVSRVEDLPGFVEYRYVPEEGGS